MGKALIIKGADFSENAVSTAFKWIQGYIIAYGTIITEANKEADQDFGNFDKFCFLTRDGKKFLPAKNIRSITIPAGFKYRFIVTQKDGIGEDFSANPMKRANSTTEVPDGVTLTIEEIYSSLAADIEVYPYITFNIGYIPDSQITPEEVTGVILKGI